METGDAPSPFISFFSFALVSHPPWFNHRNKNAAGNFIMLRMQPYFGLIWRSEREEKNILFYCSLYAAHPISYCMEYPSKNQNHVSSFCSFKFFFVHKIVKINWIFSSSLLSLLCSRTMMVGTTCYHIKNIFPPPLLHGHDDDDEKWWTSATVNVCSAKAMCKPWWSGFDKGMADLVA